MEAMECGTWRSGRRAPRGWKPWVAQVPAARGEAALRGEKAALGDEKAVGCDAEAGVMVEAAPAAALVVAEADLLLEFLVVALDAASAPWRYGPGPSARSGAAGWRASISSAPRRPPATRSAATPRPGLRAQGVAVRGPYPTGGEAGGEFGLAALAPGDRAPGPAGAGPGPGPSPRPAGGPGCGAAGSAAVPGPTRERAAVAPARAARRLVAQRMPSM